ncbi:uncharacterized protein METZ01_LOCUS463928 [marine metagenome]|uniref:Uncharacterized protein n=1 Tax=marine metagenome TaxID=408172 RepID=A0A383ATR8_9ZZZZ
MEPTLMLLEELVELRSGMMCLSDSS